LADARDEKTALRRSQGWTLVHLPASPAIGLGLSVAAINELQALIKSSHIVTVSRLKFSVAGKAEEKPSRW